MYHLVSMTKKKNMGYFLSYFRTAKQIETGELIIVGYDEKRNVVDVEYANSKEKQIKTVWHRTLHDAGAHGSDIVTSIIGKAGAFSFPKSVYSTKDAIASVVRNNKQALIIDFLLEVALLFIQLIF